MGRAVCLSKVDQTFLQAVSVQSHQSQWRFLVWIRKQLWPKSCVWKLGSSVNAISDAKKSPGHICGTFGSEALRGASACGGVVSPLATLVRKWAVPEHLLGAAVVCTKVTLWGRRSWKATASGASLGRIYLWASNHLNSGLCSGSRRHNHYWSGGSGHWIAARQYRPWARFEVFGSFGRTRCSQFKMMVNSPHWPARTGPPRGVTHSHMVLPLLLHWL